MKIKILMAAAVLGQAFAYACAALAVQYALGLGLARILLPPSLRKAEKILVPWIGLALAGVLLGYGGLLGLGTRVLWLPVLLAGILLGALSNRFRPSSEPVVDLPKISSAALFGGVILLVLFLMLPIASEGQGVTTFSIGNGDPAAYALSARELQGAGTLDLIRSFYLKRYAAENPAVVSRNVLIEQLVINPRWIPAQWLSFLCSLFGAEAAALYSLTGALAYALLLPLVWLLARSTLRMEGRPAAAALLLSAASPHLVYILYHGFVPQIMGMGFFLCLLSWLPSYLEEPATRWTDAALAALFLAGIAMSYNELLPFAALTFAAYSSFLLFTGKTGAKTILVKTSTLLGFLLLFCPFQVLTLLPAILYSHGAGAIRRGWQVTQDYYLFAYQLGAYFLQPGGRLRLRVEWVLDPVLAALLFAGLRSLPKGRAFLLCAAFPFVLYGAYAYRIDYNYAYYKNFTLVFFWVPIVLSQGLFDLWERSKSRAPAIAAAALFLAVAATASLRTLERVGGAWRNKLVVTRDLRSLDRLRSMPELEPVYLSGDLSFWEILWSIYALGPKPIGLSRWIYYFRTDLAVVSPNDPRLRFALVESGGRTVLDALDQRKTGETVFRSGRYALVRLLEPAAHPVRAVLGPGFYDVEKQAGEQWVWMGQEAQMRVETDQAAPSRELELDLYSRQDQTLEIGLNGRPAVQLRLEKDKRAVFTVRLNLRSGANDLVLRTDRPSPPRIGNDPRALNLRIFRIRVRSSRRVPTEPRPPSTPDRKS